tara:strand:- start:226 stop:411 length:186 start_codon:yes stop_codon:yes gene_type:complete
MKKNIINVDGSGYIVLGTVSVQSGYNPDKLKSMWRLADTVLRNGEEFYVCMKIIDVETCDI